MDLNHVQRERFRFIDVYCLVGVKNVRWPAAVLTSEAARRPRTTIALVSASESAVGVTIEN